MTLKVVILQSAEADLLDLRRYVRDQFGDKAWKKSYGGIKQAVKRIATHPLAGKSPVELAGLGMVQYRQLMAGMNRIIYEVRDDTAYVHIICDARRDLRSLLMRRLVETN